MLELLKSAASHTLILFINVIGFGDNSFFRVQSLVTGEERAA